MMLTKQLVQLIRAEIESRPLVPFEYRRIEKMGAYYLSLGSMRTEPTTEADESQDRSKYVGIFTLTIDDVVYSVYYGTQ